MKELTSKDRRHLRALAHHLSPIVNIGHKGVGEAVIKDVKRALDVHELIKVKFLDFKDQKKELTQELSQSTGAQSAGLIGNIAILYLQNPKENERTVHLPSSEK